MARVEYDDHLVPEQAEQFDAIDSIEVKVG